MDHFAAFALGEASQHEEMMIFDWIKAAEIIKERKPANVFAGLRGDWEHTGIGIYYEGEVVKLTGYEGGYLGSTWAVPEIDVDGVVEPCYRMESDCPGWTADTRWPQESLDILNQ